MRRIVEAYYYMSRGRHGYLVKIFISNVVIITCLLLLSFAFQKQDTQFILFGILIVSINCCFLLILLNRLQAKADDIGHAISLEAGLGRNKYVLNNFYTDGAAGNPSLQLFILKVLEFVKPASILELGSGQTTKILSCYYKQNKNIRITTLEQNSDWQRRLSQLTCHKYIYSPLVERKFLCANGKYNISTKWFDYKPNEKFDFIIVDGPDNHGSCNTTSDFSRSGILEYIPSILDSNFVVVFDDAERYGEIQTIKVFKEILLLNKIPNIYFQIHGVKSQVVLCSPTFGFLESI
jgi:hypothetical protein